MFAAYAAPPADTCAVFFTYGYCSAAAGGAAGGGAAGGAAAVVASAVAVVSDAAVGAVPSAGKSVVSNI